MIIEWYNSDTDELRSESLKWSYFFYGIAVLACLTEAIQKGVFEMIGERLSRRLRADLFRSMLRQDITWFEDDNNSLGALTSNLSTDVKYVRLVTGQSIASLIETISALTVGMTIALTASWEIFLVMFAMVPLLGFAEAMQWVAISGSETNIKNSLSNCSNILNETINGIREVQAFALEGDIAKQIETKINETVGPASKKSSIAKGVMMGLIQLIQFSVYAFAFWFGGQMIEKDRVTFGEFNKALWAMAFAASGLGQAALFAGDAAKASSAVKSVSAILDHIPSIKSRPWENYGFAEKKTGAPVIRKVSEKIMQEGKWDLKDVNFAYPTRKAAPVFNRINLKIPSGKTVALVSWVLSSFPLFYNVSLFFSSSNWCVCVIYMLLCYLLVTDSMVDEQPQPIVWIFRLEAVAVGKAQLSSFWKDSMIQRALLQTHWTNRKSQLRLWWIMES